MSDLHLEFAPFQPQDLGADVVVLAGDVHTGKNGIRWILQTFPTVPVLYVLGNHEFYGQKIPKLTQDINALAAGTNVHVLENDRVEMGGVVFLGATLWTDFALNGNPPLSEVHAAMGMTDFRRIRVTPSYRRFRPADSRAYHVQSLTWFREQMKETAGRKVVVITHHAPSPQSIAAQFQGDPLNPAFASNLESFIVESQAALWIHGHIHAWSDYRVGETRVVANPRGYPDEPFVGFNPELLLEV